MKLSYKAVTREGKIVRGIIDAKDIGEAASYLRSKEILPIKISESKNSNLFSSFRKTSTSDLVFFTRQLSSMLASGLTLMQALNILKDQMKNPFMSEIVQDIIADIEDGKSFSIAISKHPELFSSIYVSLIKASETSGLLDKVLLRLADNLEKQQKLKGTIKGALMYPAIVVTGMIVVMFIMMIFVIPQLSVLYQNLNIPLPLPTLIVVGISNILIKFWPVVIIMAVLGFIFFRRWRKTEVGQLMIDNFVLKMPIFGNLIRETILAEFTRTLGLLIGTGTLVVEALNQAATTANNVHYKNAIIGVSEHVEKGVTISDAMAFYPLFPQMVTQMVSIGEKTGKLDESLMRVSEYYEREVDQSVKNLTTAMEPIIMVILGVGVAFLIISVITPIYNLTSSIQ
ncbi:MAG: type II secretion system F family protein [Patescibacteria group bacterium]|nr:type II secretion system F family protein [Patescibacteria group bacterium]